MKTVQDFVDSLMELEEDSSDILSLFNLIVRKDARNQGYDFVPPYKTTSMKQILQTPMPMQGPGTFVTEALEEVALEEAQSKKKVDRGQDAQAPQNGSQANPDVSQQGNPPNAQVQTTTGEIIDVEFNKNDPNAHSSLPEVNNCPAFFMKDMQSAPICRVTNRVCIYMNSDYKNCGVYNTASTGDPNTFELPPGKEGTYAY